MNKGTFCLLASSALAAVITVAAPAQSAIAQQSAAAFRNSHILSVSTTPEVEMGKYKSS
jgi:hypothetical protein